VPRQVYWNARPIEELLRPEDRAVEIIYNLPDYEVVEEMTRTARARFEIERSDLVAVMDLTGQRSLLIDDGRTIVTKLEGLVREVLYRAKSAPGFASGSAIGAQVFGGRLTISGVDVHTEGYPNVTEMPNGHSYLVCLVCDKQERDKFGVSYGPLRIDEGILHYVTHVKHPVIPPTPFEGMKLSDFATIASRVK
jgi:hypothetical protein